MSTQAIATGEKRDVMNVTDLLLLNDTRHMGLLGRVHTREVHSKRVMGGSLVGSRGERGTTMSR